MREKLRKKGIESQVGYYALNKLKCYKNIKKITFSKNLEESEQAAKNSLCLPLYYELTSKHQDYVVSQVNKLLSK